jgi:hypothetical protein
MIDSGAPGQLAAVLKSVLRVVVFRSEQVVGRNKQPEVPLNFHRRAQPERPPNCPDFLRVGCDVPALHEQA